MEIISLKSEPADPPSAPAQSSKTQSVKNTITDLKSGVRDQNRVNVFIDGEFSFSLDLAQVVDYHLKIDKTLTDAEISDLKHASAYGKLYAQTLEWILMKPRSIKETRDHLTEKLFKVKLDNRRRAENRERIKSDPEFKRLVKEHKTKTRERELFTKEDIEQVIIKLQEKHYLDDRKFAEWFIENRFARKGVSTTRLRQELRQKGIEGSLIDELQENSPRNESEEIKKVIKKRGPKTDAEKLLAYLVRHGFNYDLSRDLVGQYSSDQARFFDE